jgi:predicted short-subunit dehydrogenase-like oxidoreductase (DUF2520 family)
MQQFPTISIIGTGNVAELLGQRLLKAGCILSSVIGRNQRRLVQLSSDWKCNIESIGAISGDIVLVAVSDDVTIKIIEQIEPNKIVFYTAGTIDINLIKHPLVGVFYPLQTITKNRIPKIDSFPILIESEHPEVIKKLNLIAQLISNQVSVCDSIERNKIHCIAVFINNFSNHVIHIGQSIATKEKIDFSLFPSLLKETFEKLNEMNAKDAQTGPARRNDLETISNHLNLLTESEKSIYLALTNSILTTYDHDQL